MKPGPRGCSRTNSASGVQGTAKHTSGLGSRNQRIVGGLYVVCTWFVRGLYVVCTWFVRGLYVVCTWFVRGLYVVCTWFVRGLYVVCM